ncbi:hypothetical protein IEQ34_025297 [Dendrobium chrysotoxum]|uniref:NADH-ubiquinone oxidoreductase chain 3 n=1 Tax=Dendrobium chrysotoxum TaxID=161865 RepID=A0AAV7FQW1_DENCH|nr:hypothetical protein IEQ34_025297 [Dendrobium chrysotoxum]
MAGSVTWANQPKNKKNCAMPPLDIPIERKSCCLPRLGKVQKSFLVMNQFFVVFDVETVFLYPWAMSFDVLGVSVFIEAFIFVLIPIVGSFPLLNQKTPNSIISTTSNDLSNWSRLSSLWPLLYGTSCCFIEFASLIGSRFDFDRYGLVAKIEPKASRPHFHSRNSNNEMAPL